MWWDHLDRGVRHLCLFHWTVLLRPYLCVIGITSCVYRISFACLISADRPRRLPSGSTGLRFVTLAARSTAAWHETREAPVLGRASRPSSLGTCPTGPDRGEKIAASWWAGQAGQVSSMTEMNV